MPYISAEKYWHVASHNLFSEDYLA